VHHVDFSLHDYIEIHCQQNEKQLMCVYTYVRLYVCMYVCVYVCMYECMYIRIYVEAYNVYAVLEISTTP